MKEDNNDLTLLVIVFWIMMFLLVLSSCSTSKNIGPISATNRYEVTHDTIYQIDSIYVSTHTIIREADSSALAAMGIQMSDMRKSWIIKEESLRREIHSLKSRSSDTTYITDTLWLPYEVEKVVETEASLNAWQKTRIAIGNIAIIAALVWLAVKLRIL